jgi:hypothetical protein
MDATKPFRLIRNCSSTLLSYPLNSLSALRPCIVHASSRLSAPPFLVALLKADGPHPITRFGYLAPIYHSVVVHSLYSFPMPKDLAIFSNLGHSASTKTSPRSTVTLHHLPYPLAIPYSSQKLPKLSPLKTMHTRCRASLLPV